MEQGVERGLWGGSVPVSGALAGRNKAGVSTPLWPFLPALNPASLFSLGLSEPLPPVHASLSPELPFSKVSAKRPPPCWWAVWGRCPTTP